MAENAPPTDSATRQPVHPFFALNRPAVPETDKSLLANDAPNASDNPISRPNTNESDKPEDSATENLAPQRSRRRKAEQELDQDETPKKARSTKRTRNSAGGGIANHFVKLGKGGESDEPAGSSVDALVHNDELPSRAVNGADDDDQNLPADGPETKSPTIEQPAALPNGCVPEPTTAPPATEASLAKPKKLLQFNPKTGTIGSPPRPKELKVAAEEGQNTEKKPPSRRGRKPASRIVRIAYGTDPTTRVRLGESIDAILSGQTQHPDANPKHPPPSRDKKQSPKARKTTPSKSSKAPHPFFLGQAKKVDPTPTDSKPKTLSSSPLSARTKHYSSTPFSPRKPRAGPPPRVPMPQFGVKSLGLKFPGAKLPAWPWQGMVHVRGDEGEALVTGNELVPLSFRKSKGNAIKIPADDLVTTLVADSMELPVLAEAVRNINTDDVVPPPPELRLPQKHFESGSKLQSRILSELKTFQHSPPAKKSAPCEGSMRAPPQLARLFGSISSSLSAFDMSQCETANWVQKYTPVNAVEVLQPGREAFFLRDWLQALMVQSVDTGSAEPDKSKAGSKAKAAGKKKRRKKLDGFIVSSEDEGYELYEPSDEDDDWAPNGSRGILRKTVIRSGNLSQGKDGDKTANTLVISGPHGCGKTAAVYAVAKELDFDVFEINPSSRRSGKDVLEKIGDMTRNHHVQQHQSTSAPDNQDATAEDDTDKDIKSGKQSTMAAFFKAKTAGAKPKQPAKPAAKSLQSETKKDPPKSQRQSLILLEEVDILYEEDKQFWVTVVSLIAQAKRPFIMTCNDETLVPLHTLNLHGIFRLSPPPRDLSVDRLILIAANEGHALTRQSVEQFYDSRKRDLRAATMDLQYWCQIGVGDRRGGFDWFYPRWPKGVDLDENKEVVRVISQDTYRPGMNLLERDSIVDPKLSPRLVEEEILHQTWQSWGLDIGHWQDSIGLASWAEGLELTTATPADRLGALEAYDGLAEAMSAADVCSFRSFAAFKEEAMDTTQPQLPAKIRDDFVLGIAHLGTPIITHYDTLTTAIASTIKSLAKSSMQLRTERFQKHAEPALGPLGENQAIDCLQASFTSTLPETSVVGRMDFAFAFDPIAASDTGSPLQLGSYLEPSVFDRTLKLITVDVAPYVRGIVAYDSHLQKQRRKLSSLVSEGGRGAQGSKRMRTTRSALSALEGGSRSTTRGERWFKGDINPYLVAKTAGEGWNGFAAGDLEMPEESTKSSVKSSPKSSPDTTPTTTPKKAVLKGRKRKMVIEDDDEADVLSI
ncbi:hypothetical protein C8A00DRAFT_33752 [Chaetomidium leptoderma]|uniref:AAA+ ATPase domain-containing protein n=1 Tax=Chaetomidium leptoderma TaxID=669021 RepID=A0AAN6VL13_9PEZI|nr:hypothetical protein C8A00DRAFT_33752 [Chaetomidium leptoderma]